MHFLTEIKNSVGLLKEGEKQLAGDNFDTNVQEATTKDKNLIEGDSGSTGKKWRKKVIRDNKK